MRDEAVEAAWDVVQAVIDSSGVDYDDHIGEIAAFFRDWLWQGNWEGTLVFEGGLDSLRFVQEDEHDNNSEDVPWPGSQVCLVRGHYIYRLD